MVSWLVPTPEAGDAEDTALRTAAVRVDAAPLGHADAQAYVREAYDTFQRDIFSFALHSSHDPDVAADVTQDAFLRLMKEAERRGPPDHVKAWLMRVAVNLMISRGRRLTVADRWLRRAGHATETTESPEAGVLRQEHRDRVQAVLKAVTPDARACLMMAAEGFTGREIAAAIGRTEMATRVLMSRARNQLRALMAAGDDSLADGEPRAW